MNKHHVILEDGTKATRNSKNRTYTHAVAVSPLALDVAIEQFTARINEYEQNKANAIALVEDLKTYGVTITDRESFGSVWSDFSVNGKPVYLSGVYRAGTVTVEEATAKAIEKYEAHVTEYDERIAVWYDQMATAKEQGQWGHWDVVTWCGRYDLAVAQLNKWAGRRGYTAKIVEVEVGA